MRIGFDAKRALNNGSGLGNYSRNLLNALMHDFKENNYLLFSPKAKDEFLNQLEGDFKVIFPESRLQKIAPAIWRSFGIKSQLFQCRTDIYHGLSNELPFGIQSTGIASVVTIHDLIFLKNKEQYPFIDRQVYELKSRYAVKHADTIIAVSGETKRDLIEVYGADEKKIVVIAPPIAPVFQRAQNQEQRTQILQKYKLPEKYILNVGSFFPRKNQKTLIEAFDLIKNKVQENLVLVGGAGNMLNEIKALIAAKGLQARVKIVTGVANEDMPAIYQGARLFVFPALYEGFGMPVAEALFSKVPVITTGGGAMEEAGGKDSLYVDPLSPNEIATAILKISGDEKLRTGMIESGWTHAQTMTDTIIAEKTMKVYGQL